MLLPTEDITPLIPQAAPFIMIGKLLYSDDTMTRSSFVIHRDNVLVSGEEFQEAGLLENIAQTAAARAGYTAKLQDQPVMVGYIGAVKALEIFFLPKVNDELLTEIKIENQIFDVNIISGKVWCNNQLAAQCEMKVFTNISSS